MKDYSVLDGMRKQTSEIMIQAFEKGYKQGYTDGKDEAYKNPVPTQDAYQKGLDDAWKAARIIYGMDKDTRLVTTAFVHYETVFDNYSASEAISRIKEYKEKQKAVDKIQVGDEIKYIEDGGLIGIVTCIYDERAVNILCSDGVMITTTVDGATKTGRHFDQIEEVLKQMQEDKE